MKLATLVFVPFLMYGQTYMAKIEPFETFTVYAQTNGKITYLDKKDETKIVDKTIIKLDDTLEQNELISYKKQLEFYEEKLRILTKNYERFIQITGKSAFEKDEKYYSILDLKITIENIKIHISQLEDTLSKKRINLKNLYLKEFKVNNGDYISTGAQLATAYEINNSKLIVYINRNDYENIASKKVLINGKEGLGQITKIDKIQDSTMLSAYKIEIVLKDKDFGKIVDVEFVK